MEERECKHIEAKDQKKKWLEEHAKVEIYKWKQHEEQKDEKPFKERWTPKACA